MGPFGVIKLSQTAVTIDKDGIHNNVSVDWATVAPTADEMPKSTTKRKAAKQTLNGNEFSYGTRYWNSRMSLTRRKNTLRIAKWSCMER